jgi:hypothetical protein
MISIRGLTVSGNRKWAPYNVAFSPLTRCAVVVEAMVAVQAPAKGLA